MSLLKSITQWMTGDTLVIQTCRPALASSQVCDLTFYRAKGAQARVAGRGRWRRVSAGEQMQQRRQPFLHIRTSPVSKSTQRADLTTFARKDIRLGSLHLCCICKREARR